MLQATQRNICNVLGTEAKKVRLSKTKIKNGYQLRGFLSRYSLENLQSEFHVYVSRDGAIVVLTRGRLSLARDVSEYHA